MVEHRPVSVRSLLLLRRGRPQAEQGMLASTLGTIVLLLFGSAALVASSLTWQTASSRGGDAEQAREAAEWGFNTLVDRLNEPGNNYLLVSNWANWATTAGLRTTCGITTDSRGSLPPADLAGETQTVGSRQVRYRLTNFVPPQYPSGTAPAALPQTCKDSFGNLAGGTARLTVAGDVLQDGRVIASHSMERNVTVDSVAGVGFGGGGGGPVSPPMTFLATGSGRSGNVSLGSTDPNDRPEFLYDRNKNFRASSGDVRVDQIYCLVSCNGSSDLTNGIGSRPAGRAYRLESLSVADFLKVFPPSPPYASNLDNRSTLTINSNNIPANFPYNNSGGLLGSCAEVFLPVQTGAPEKVIGCKVRLNIGDKDKQLVVHTDRSKLPVVLYLMGSSHLVGEGGSIVNRQFQLDSARAPVESTNWSMLRIYGDPSPNFRFEIKEGMNSSQLGQCTNGDKQDIKFEKDVLIDGAVIWLPKSDVTIDDHSSKYSTALFGTVWACKIKVGKNAVILNNSDPEDVRKGLDSAFGLVGGAPARYVARGVERTLQSSAQ
jgi:hypothetical protein